MRTCKYTMQMGNNWRAWEPERKHAARWKRFVAICQGLTRDGFDFQVAIASDHNDEITLTISGTATGKLVAPRKPAKRAHTMVAKVTPEKCAKMAGESRRAALAGVVPQRRRMSAWEYDAKKRAEDRRIGRMIARAKARGETMVDLSRVYDFRCMQGVGTLITERKQRVWPMSEDVAVHPMEARRLRLADLAEYRYWRELESLTGQRDKFRPGVEDTLCSDDELAGVAA